MVKVFEGTENEYYIDGYHKVNLDVAKKVVKNDWDMLFCYDGDEGSGKSVKAMQDAFYCDPTLTLNRITFNPDAFRKAVKNAQPYQAVILDEAYGSLSSRGTMGKVNRVIVQMLTVIRAKNLIIFIVLPSFFDLDKYVALWRSRALVHVYTGEGFQRGFFAFYNKDRKKQLYIAGKKFYSYSFHMSKPNFSGRFTNHYVIDEDAYREKKDSTSFVIEEVMDERVPITSRLHKECPDMTQIQMAKVIGVSERTIRRYLKKSPGLPVSGDE